MDAKPLLQLIYCRRGKKKQTLILIYLYYLCLVKLNNYNLRYA